MRVNQTGIPSAKYLGEKGPTGGKEASGNVDGGEEQLMLEVGVGGLEGGDVRCSIGDYQLGC